MQIKNPARIVSISIGGILALLFWVLFSATPSQNNLASSPLLGHAAPAVVSQTTTGEAFDLSRRKGSWVVLNFFNSTCVPCINEHPLLLGFAESQAVSSDSVELYTIINDDSSTAVTNFFSLHGGTWPRVTDENGTIAVAFGVARVPETWVIDPNGIVRLRITGELTENLLESELEDLRQEFNQ